MIKATGGSPAQAARDARPLPRQGVPLTLERSEPPGVRGRLRRAARALRAAQRSWGERARAAVRVTAGQPLLPVVRRAFLVFLLACLAVVVPQWSLAPVVPPERSWPVLPALAVLAVTAVRLYRRERPRLTVDLLNAACTGVVIWSVGALPAGGVLFVGVAFRALYGRSAGAMLSAVLTLAAMTGGVLAAGGGAADVRLGQYAPGLLSTSLTLRLVFVAVRRYETGAEARFEAVVRSSRDVILITDAGTTATFVSPALGAVFGLADAALPGGRLLTWIVDDDREAAGSWVSRLLAEPGSATTFSCRVPTAEGVAHVEISGQNLLADPHVRGLLFAVRDVTQRTLLLEQLRHQAFHDPLTGLGNRALLGRRLIEALSPRPAAGGRPRACLLLLDIDSFKAVNDTAGHLSGDEVLVEIAARLGRRVHPDDTLARLGGDEFAVLLAGARADPRVAEQVAGTLLAVFEAPVVVGGVHRRISASIGIAVGDPVDGDPAGGDPTDGDPADGADRLMREVDVALYRAKSGGKGRYVQYRHELHRHAVEQMRTQLELTEALQRREFVLHYQPVVDLGTGAWTGVEALLRWNRPGHGLAGPADFIALAENSGLIVPLGRWVLHEACSRGAAWRRIAGRPLRVNVNVSMCQLTRGTVIADVHEALGASGLPPEDLTLEITESALGTDDVAVESQLAAVRGLGVRVALDDFGTGYNSLGHLHRYPVDELKIDKSFVAGLGAGRESLPVVDAIMAMSRSLRLSTVAEGIESEEQHARLVELGCGRGQGFRLSPPLGAAAVEAALQGLVRPDRGR